MVDVIAHMTAIWDKAGTPQGLSLLFHASQDAHPSSLTWDYASTHSALKVPHPVLLALARTLLRTAALGTAIVCRTCQFRRCVHAAHVVGPPPQQKKGEVVRVKKRGKNAISMSLRYHTWLVAVLWPHFEFDLRFVRNCCT